MNTQTKSPIQRPSEGVIIIGSTRPGYPHIVRSKCSGEGCAQELAILSWLKKDSALKFDKCRSCAEKARTAQWQAKLKTQFEALPEDVRAAVELACLNAKAEAASKKGGA
jgi:hypothetical protein